jgi:transcription elongation factor GreA
MSKFLTPENLEKIKKELDYLKKVKRKEIARKLKEAIAMGDLSENAAYQEAKDAQGFLEGKILELEKLIGQAKVVEKIAGAHWVQIGSTVILSPQKETKSSLPAEKYKIVGSGQADPLKGEISIDSPFGKVLLNKPEGAIVTVKTPVGKVKYKILKIE